jgi:cytochrome c5
MNVAGKSGIVIKTVTINSSAGTKILTVRANVPPPQMAAASMSALERERNQQLAKVDRMAVFKGDCARCHLEPARWKMGKDLFVSACGVCHLATHRASMVPDLKTVNSEGDAEYWRNWITKGKAGSLMPAWAESEGGPLTPGQIESVVQDLVAELRAPQPIPPPTPR